jgi:hypothetical protein
VHPALPFFLRLHSTEEEEDKTRRVEEAEQQIFDAITLDEHEQRRFFWWNLAERKVFISHKKAASVARVTREFARMENSWCSAPGREHWPRPETGHTTPAPSPTLINRQKRAKNIFLIMFRHGILRV